MLVNVLTGRTSWEALCRLAQGWCNYPQEVEGEFLSDHLYMSSASFGGRTVDGLLVRRDYFVDEPQTVRVEVSTWVKDPYFGADWGGFAQSCRHTTFEWESAASGAKLTATREGESWILSFRGCDTSIRGESAYFASFLDAVKPEDLVYVEVNNGLSLLTQLVDLALSYGRLSGGTGEERDILVGWVRLLSSLKGGGFSLLDDDGDKIIIDDEE